MDIEVGVTHALKGTAPSAPVLVRYFIEPHTFSPTVGLLDKLNGKDGILFLFRVDEEGSSSFFINDPNALQPSSPEALLAIESEVAAQDAILKNYRRPDIRDNAYRRVRNLVNNMTHPERAEDALSELQSLGKEYVPAMIHLMDDRRPLTIKQIAVSNPPGHWEGIAHYAPECVVDVMSVMLSRITGETFGQIHDGGSEREEAAEVDAWRIYLHHLNADSEKATQAPAG